MWPRVPGACDWETRPQQYVAWLSDSLNSTCRTTRQEHTAEVLGLVETVSLLEPQSSQLLNGSNQAARLELLGK